MKPRPCSTCQAHPTVRFEDDRGPLRPARYHITCAPCKGAACGKSIADAVELWNELNEAWPTYEEIGAMFAMYKEGVR